MAHFGFKNKHPYYQFDKWLFFIDLDEKDSDLEVYPGNPSGKFLYLWVDWFKVETKNLKGAFKFSEEPVLRDTLKSSEGLADNYRIILPQEEEIVYRVDVVIRYPHYIDIFINDEQTSYNYAHRGSDSLPEDTEFISLTGIFSTSQISS